MPKYMLQASYSTEGVRGVTAEGGSGRRAAVEKMVTEMGGRLECFYFALGEVDAFVVVDVPDLTAVAAVALAVNASGKASVRTVALLTPEEVDAAAKTPVAYRPPGS